MNEPRVIESVTNECQSLGRAHESSSARAEQLIACLEGEIAKRDEELAACRVAVENCEVFRARIAELEAKYLELASLSSRISVELPIAYAQAIIDGLRGEVAAQRVKTCTALKERNDAREERDAAATECERLRMQLAACGVVALSNTIESAGKARQMHPDYMSASCSDVAGAVDREIALRTERDQQARRIGELEGLLRDSAELIKHGVFEDGICCCGASVDSHGLGDGHSPVDALAYHAGQVCERIDAALSAGKDSVS